MTCYAVPTAAFLIHLIAKKNIPSMNSREQSWLSMLFAGASIFGIIDHWWNGELFLMGPNIVTDLALGFLITLGVMIAWVALVFKERRSEAALLAGR